MTNLWQFMSDSPWLTFFLAVLAALLIEEVIGIPNRVLRHWNIHKHGYPPPHCDADGDFKKEAKDDQEA